MPLLKIHTNRSLDASTQTALLHKASATVAERLGKPERYVMVTLDADRPMLFAGNDAPLAYLELKSIGLPDNSTTTLSAALCDLISDELNIPSDRIYIEFSNAERQMWGWDGRTF